MHYWENTDTYLGHCNTLHPQLFPDAPTAYPERHLLLAVYPQQTGKASMLDEPHLISGDTVHSETYNKYIRR